MSSSLVNRFALLVFFLGFALPGLGQVSTETLLPTNLNFGYVAVGALSASQAVTVNNTGANAIIISAIDSRGDFTQTNDCPISPGTLAPGSTCSINVNFQPSSLGNRLGAITVSDDAAGSPHTISLSGTGVGAAYMWGRDTWIIPGTSHVMRILGDVDLFAPGVTPVVTVAPGPVTVNYVVVGSTRDLTVSVTVPAGTPAGTQSLFITDGTLSTVIPDALQVVDGAVKNPSPSILPLGGSATLSIAANPLFLTQTQFTLDLGPDVSVGSATLQSDGTLQAPVSVTPWAIPGTRSVHVTAGPYTFLAERGFAIDFGPLVSQVTLNGQMVSVPAGYTASVFAKQDGTNGLNSSAQLCVDSKNIAYVLNQPLLPSPPNQFSVSVFDLNEDNFGTYIRTFPNLDAAGLGGLLENCTFLPANPGILYVSLEDFPPSFGGGKDIIGVDTATGTSSLFYYNPNVNIDPLGTDPAGNMVVSVSMSPPYYGGVYELDPAGKFLKSCPIQGWSDEIHVDPLTGLILAEGPVSSNQRGLQTLDLDTCKTRARSDGPVDYRFDEGDFGPAAGNFGNQYFVAVEGDERLATFVPVPYTDPSQFTPERYVIFAKGLGIANTARFDREGKYIIVADNSFHNAIDVIYRIPGYQPPVAVASLSIQSLNFGTQLVGSMSTSQTLTLTNTGEATLTVAGIGITGDFDQLSDCPIAPAMLAAGESCSIYVAFAPTVAGRRDGTIILTSSASPQPQTIPLLGTGKNFDLTAVAESVSVLAGTSSATFTLSSTATSSFLGQIPLVCSGAAPATCSFNPSAITAGQSSTLTVSGLGAISGGTTIDFVVDGTFGTQSDSLPLSITVADFSLSATQSSVTIPAGQTATFRLNLASLGGFDQTVNLQCTGAPTAATCALGQTTVSFTGTPTATVLVTVSTTARSVTGPPETPLAPQSPLRRPFMPTWWLAFALFLGLLSAGRIGRRFRSRLVFASFTIAVLTWIACGGGGGSSTTPPPSGSGTPAGTYSLVVTGSSAGSLGSLTHTANLSLTVN